MTSEPIISDYELPQYKRYIILTVGWNDHFDPLLTRNQDRLYKSIASFFNPKMQRAFPKTEHLRERFCGDWSEVCRNREPLALLGLIEWWYGPYRLTPHGTVHWGRFYRLPFVDSKGHHMGCKQQPSAAELFAMGADVSRTYPELAWVRYAKSKLLTPLVSDEQVADQEGLCIAKYYRKPKTKAANAPIGVNATTELGIGDSPFLGHEENGDSTF